MDRRSWWQVLQRIEGQKVITVDDVVRSYKHLGTIHTATGNMTEEATARVRAMMVAYRALAGRVFGFPKLSLRTKLRLADTLLWSHPSLRYGDLERVSTRPTCGWCVSVQGDAELQGIGQRMPSSVRNCEYRAYQRCCTMSDCDTWREPPKRVYRNSVLSCRMREERRRHGWH